MGQSPPRCESLRLPQRGSGRKAGYLTIAESPRPPWNFAGYATSRWNSSMNWLQGDMNPARGDIAYPISEEQKL